MYLFPQNVAVKVFTGPDTNAPRTTPKDQLRPRGAEPAGPAGRQSPGPQPHYTQPGHLPPPCDLRTSLATAALGWRSTTGTDRPMARQGWHERQAPEDPHGPGTKHVLDQYTPHMRRRQCMERSLYASKSGSSPETFELKKDREAWQGQMDGRVPGDRTKDRTSI